MDATKCADDDRPGCRARLRILGEPRTRGNEMRRNLYKQLLGGVASALAGGVAERTARSVRRQRGRQQLKQALEAWEYEGGALSH